MGNARTLMCSTSRTTGSNSHVSSRSHAATQSASLSLQFSRNEPSGESLLRSRTSHGLQRSLSPHSGLETISRKPGSKERRSRREPSWPDSRRRTAIAVRQGSASLQASGRSRLVFFAPKHREASQADFSKLGPNRSRPRPARLMHSDARIFRLYPGTPVKLICLGRSAA